eukprot:gene25471-34023_t
MIYVVEFEFLLDSCSNESRSFRETSPIPYISPEECSKTTMSKEDPGGSHAKAIACSDFGSKALKELVNLGDRIVDLRDFWKEKLQTKESDKHYAINLEKITFPIIDVGFPRAFILVEFASHYYGVPAVHTVLNKTVVTV